MEIVNLELVWMTIGKIGCLNYERKNRSHMQVAGYVGSIFF
jgi:hypothetical protein